MKRHRLSSRFVKVFEWSRLPPFSETVHLCGVVLPGPLKPIAISLHRNLPRRSHYAWRYAGGMYVAPLCYTKGYRLLFHVLAVKHGWIFRELLI